MTTNTHTPTAPTSAPDFDARRLLLPYSLSLIAAMSIVQTVIAVNGGTITLLAALLTAAVGLGALVWVIVSYRKLARIRFGLVIAHAITFVTVTTAFNAHAIVRVFAISSETGSAEGLAQGFFGTPWFGTTLMMSGLWGVGILLHLIGTVLGRGWED